MEILRHIDIEGLWAKYDFSWNLYERVNVLSGINGSGKTTILRCLNHVLQGEFLPSFLAKRLLSFSITFEDRRVLCLQITPIKLTVENNGKLSEAYEETSHPSIVTTSKESKTEYSQIWLLDGKEASKEEVKEMLKNLTVGYISTFDTPVKLPVSPMKQFEYFLKSSYSELDRHLDCIVDEYRTYQEGLSREMENLMKDLNETKKPDQLVFDKLKAIFERRDHLHYIIDEMMRESGKHLDPDKGNLQFIFHADDTSHPYRELSAGEKQLLLILLKIFMQGRKNAILIMDEPEISLHVDWQKSLIDKLQELNPNCQLIVATHSPAMIIKGWQSAVVNISDLAKQQ